MLPPFIKLLRNTLFVLAATLVAGFIVSMSLGAAQRGTPIWHLSMTLTNAVLCVTVFFISAHLAMANRFVHVWIVAAMASLPNLFLFAVLDDMTHYAYFVTLLMLLAYASIGGGLSYAFRRSRRMADGSVV